MNCEICDEQDELSNKQNMRNRPNKIEKVWYHIKEQFNSENLLHKTLISFFIPMISAYIDYSEEPLK